MKARQLYLSNGFLDDFGISDLCHKKVFRRTCGDKKVRGGKIKKIVVDSIHSYTVIPTGNIFKLRKG